MAVISDIEDRGAYTWVRINRYGPNGLYEKHGHNAVEKIDEWCKVTECGKWVNINAVAFKNKEEVSMFLLRWA